MPTRSDRDVPRRRFADDGGVHVNFITRVGLDEDGAILAHTQGASVARRLRPLCGVAGLQLTVALLEQTHVRGGTWTSSATLADLHNSSRRFLFWVSREYGIEDLTDPGFTPAVAWEGVTSVSTNGGQQRNFRTFLADALSDLRDDGTTHRSVLLGRALPVETYDLQGYAPEVTEAIERVAKVHVGRWFVRHQNSVRKALHGDLPGDWLRLPAENLCAGATSLPNDFRVHARDLCAAMVLLSLLDDKGPNLSVIHSHTSDSVTHAGDDAAFVTSVKARNRQVLRTPAPKGGLFSYAGLLEFITAATRVERYFRDDGSDFARLLFVATGSTKVIDSRPVRAWWRSTSAEWPDPRIPRPASLSFPRLRKSALLRGKKHSRIVVGHSRKTGRLYLADALPDVILIPGLVDTQNSVTAYWRKQTLPTGPGDEVAAEDIACAPKVMDVGVAMCVSNGQSPTNAERPCGLGPVACFVCPNGYRTPEVIPGLVAAIEFTDGIRKQEPKEWLSGDAPVLHTLARKALDQFPPPVVAAASREDINNARALIACVYMEGRRRD